MIDRIAKLIALAEAAGTEAEATAAFEKAQELAARHNLDLTVARARQQDKQKREQPVTRSMRIGDRGTRSNASLVLLYSAIARANDVSVLIANDSTQVFGTGYPSDLDAVEALWASLATTMTRFGDALVRDKHADWRNETVRVWSDAEWDYVDKKVSGQGARRAYYDGFVHRIGERLREVRAAADRAAETRHFHDDAPVHDTQDHLPSSMALVLKEKKQEVEQAQDAWYTSRYGKRRAGSWKGGRSTATHSTSARAAGKAAADRASLSGRRSIAS